MPDEDLEWAVRLALEVRRRVKEQQKRIGSAEFRNTQFSYTVGNDGVEKFVVTPERQSEDHVGRDPLPAGQVWAISPGAQDEGSRLYRIEVSTGPGNGVRILNRPAPPPFAESIKYAEQNLYARVAELVGDPALSAEGAIDPLGLYTIADALNLAVRLCPGVRERQSRPRWMTVIAAATPDFCSATLDEITCS